jgi:hypothetical protein
VGKAQVNISVAVNANYDVFTVNLGQSERQCSRYLPFA